MIPKFELCRVKIYDFTSAESWTILTLKVVRRLGRVYCEIPCCDVMLGITFCLRSLITHHEEEN